MLVVAYRRHTAFLQGEDRSRQFHRRPRRRAIAQVAFQGRDRRLRQQIVENCGFHGVIADRAQSVGLDVCQFRRVYSRPVQCCGNRPPQAAAG